VPGKADLPIKAEATETGSRQSKHQANSVRI